MSIDEDFQRFWSAYPEKKGKGVARQSFAKALKKTTLQTMLAAIEAYKVHKPTWKAFCHPATWLNQERWDDEWEPDPIPPSAHGALKEMIRRQRDGADSPRTH